MGFRKDGFATVWEVKTGKGNYSDVRISTSKKNKQTDQYETDFSGFVRFAGDAHKNASGLKEKDRIKLGDCDVTNSYNKEKNEFKVSIRSKRIAINKSGKFVADDGRKVT